MGRNRIRITLFLLLLNTAVCFAKIDAVCELILNENEIATGIKEGNAQCILTNDVRWKIKINGDLTEARQATYKVCIHLQYHRTCQVPSGFYCPNLNYEEVISEIFHYECYTGMYYVEVESYLNGKIEENRLYYWCLTPPIKSFSEPYKYPVNNQRPVSFGKILNGGPGNIITGPVVRFQIWGNDPDGNENLGVMYWKIMTKWEVEKPIHPPNYNAPRERNQYKTYIPYANIPVQEWDTQENPSDIGEYVLSAFFIDEHGRFGAGYQETFYYHGDDTGNGGGDPIDTVPPGPPRNFRLREWGK